MFEKHRFTSDVILIDINGTNLGKMRYSEALEIAKTHNLGLIEVSKQDNLSVCRIGDLGRFLYEQKKKQKQTHALPQKEIKISVRIAEHDFLVKKNKIDELLTHGNDVRIVIEMRGREKAHPEIANQMLNSLLLSFPECKYDNIKKNDGNLSTIVHPKPKTK